MATLMVTGPGTDRALRIIDSDQDFLPAHRDANEHPRPPLQTGFEVLGQGDLIRLLDQDPVAPHDLDLAGIGTLGPSTRRTFCPGEGEVPVLCEIEPESRAAITPPSGPFRLRTRWSPGRRSMISTQKWRPGL